VPTRPKSRACLLLASALALAAAGCGSTGGGVATSGEQGLPDTIRITATLPTSGVMAFAGGGAVDGYRLAVEEINDTDFLGTTDIELDEVDTKGEASVAAQAMTKAIKDSSVSAVFGSVASNDAIAQSALAQKQGMPVIYTQAGSDGVVIGDYTYRATPLMSAYYPSVRQYLEEQGWRSMGVIYTSASPTLVQIAEETVPALADELGISVVKSIATPASTQDFSPTISQVLGEDPDGVVVLQLGAANPTAMQQLRQAGYDGPVLGNQSASSGNLAPAGADGADMVWASDFHVDMPDASTQDFVEAYRARYDEDPLAYAAEGYDAAWFVARAIKAADSADRDLIKDAMADLAKEPFTGALGEGLAWKDNELQVHGVVVRWTGTAEEILYVDPLDGGAA
jgi:branched-chain amino acid transport system substrate-binding protein